MLFYGFALEDWRTGWPEDLTLLKLIKYKIQIGDMQRRASEYKKLRALKFKLNPMNDILLKEFVRITWMK